MNEVLLDAIENIQNAHDLIDDSSDDSQNNVTKTQRESN